MYSRVGCTGAKKSKVHISIIEGQFFMQNFMGIMMHFVRIFFEGGKLPGFAPQGGNIIFLKYGHNFFSGHFMKKLRALS